MNALSKAWKKENSRVPCAVYGSGEATLVDKIVSLTHGKGEKAGRAKWNAVARARHNRDKASASEPGLDLLEKYLKRGKNITPQESERWGGDYPLTVLDEAIQRVAPRLGFSSAPELAANYPGVGKHRDTVEAVLHDVGGEALTFLHIRSKTDDFAQLRYGIPPLPQPSQTTGAASPAGASGPAGNYCTGLDWNWRPRPQENQSYCC